jgi:hypothetical protein
VRQEKRGAAIGQEGRLRGSRANPLHAGHPDVGHHHHRDERFDVEAGKRAVEGGVGHAHHRQRIPVDLDRPADDLRVSAELPLPETVAEHDHRVAARHDLIRRQEGATQGGRTPSTWK